MHKQVYVNNTRFWEWSKINGHEALNMWEPIKPSDGLGSAFLFFPSASVFHFLFGIILKSHFNLLKFLQKILQGFQATHFHPKYINSLDSLIPNLNRAAGQSKSRHP